MFTTLKTVLAKPWVLFLLAVLVVALAWGYYVYIYTPGHYSAQQAAFLQNQATLQTGRTILVTGGSSAAIPYLQQADTNATSNDQKARAEVNLGEAYVEGGMLVQGVDLWKSVSLNVDYPMNYRSTAAQDLVGYYYGNRDIAFAVDNIFSGPEWGTFMQGEPQTVAGLDIATLRAFKWVESFDAKDPNSFPVSYRLASLYASFNLTPSANSAINLTNAQHYLAIGDTAYQQAVAINVQAAKADPSDPLPFVNSVIAAALTSKAQALGFLYREKAGSVTFSMVTTAYNQTLEVLEGNPAEASNNIGTDIFTRFDYAQFLQQAGSAATNQQITAVLTPIYKAQLAYPKSTFFQEFLTSYATDPDLKGSGTWKTIVALANIDPRFKTMLVNLGWSASDLQ